MATLGTHRGFFRRRNVTIRSFGSPNTPLSVAAATKPGKENNSRRLRPVFIRKTPYTQSEQESTDIPQLKDGLIDEVTATTGCRNHPHDSAMSLEIQSRVGRFQQMGP
jgi:hypothetical protein